MAAKDSHQRKASQMGQTEIVEHPISGQWQVLVSKDGDVIRFCFLDHEDALAFKELLEKTVDIIVFS